MTGCHIAEYDCHTFRVLHDRPPHLLDQLSRAADPLIAAAARRTLVEDAANRTARRLTTVVGAAPVPRAADAPADKPKRTIHDAQHKTTLPGKKVRGEGEKPTKDATVNRAYAGLGATFELFRDAYRRNSIDGSGLPLDATVHYDRDYNNAFWNGDQMVFGDGDGKIFLDFTIAVDVIGHELAHGVTQYTANLAYFGQPGALNESMSDVFGSLVKQKALGQSAEQADWLIGAGLLAPEVQGVALRSMKAPGTAYDDDVLGRTRSPRGWRTTCTRAPTTAACTSTPASQTTPSTCSPRSWAATPGSGPGRSGTTC